ncbi:MAG: hypothetical protein HKN84_12790 [Gammaproteobacteria bacterium]|nr:hypothetical protein [Gammaproteobacteria bacterium]
MAADLSSDPAATSAATEKLERIAAWLDAAPGDAGVPLGKGYQAATTLYESPYGNFVIKKASGVWPWRAFSEAAIRREHKIYSIIDGVAGVPQCLGLIGGRILVLEHIEGTTFRRGEGQIKNWDSFFAKLLDTLRGIHALGVAHGDLKRKDNLLIGPGEQPYIVDFGVASIEKRATMPWSNAIYRWMHQYDYNAWVKLKNRRELDNLSPEDAALYIPTATERVARTIRTIWQKLTLRRLRRRVWPRRS